MTTISRITELYHRHVNGEATESERIELFALADVPENERLFMQLFGTSWEELGQKGKELEQLKTLPPKIPVFRRKWRVAAAAAVLALAVSTTAVLLTNRKKHNPAPIPLSVQNDVLPGGNKATLTLSGGRQLVLDSAAQDTMLIEGTAIIANAGGRLAYNSGSRLDSAGNHPEMGLTYNTLTTPRGGQYQLTLPDGTKVWLNAASSITYPTAFTGVDRRVAISGEAYLEVAQKAEQPFKVIVNDMEIDVLGTSFNVNCYADEASINTTVQEGKVRVMRSPKQVTLSSGQQAQVIVTDGDIKLIGHADVEQAVAWKDGRFSFQNADLSTVMRQLARWYNVEITYEGMVPDQHFSGRIGRDLTLDQVLKILTGTGVHYQIRAGEQNKLIIRP